MSSLVLKAQICRNIATTSKSSKNPAADYRHHGPASQISHHLLYPKFPYVPMRPIPKITQALGQFVWVSEEWIYHDLSPKWQCLVGRTLFIDSHAIIVRLSLDYPRYPGFIGALFIHL